MVDVLTIRSRMREAFQTFRTLERLLAGVKATMFRQVVLVLESLVAVGALVRTRICKSKLLKLTHTFVFERELSLLRRAQSRE